MRKIFVLTSLLVLIYSSLLADCKFGCISYATSNIGDDIQAMAIKRFLPDSYISIDRDFINVFKHDQVVPIMLNGWFMQTRNMGWNRTDRAPPIYSWPPSPSIDPLLVSIHLNPDFVPSALTKEGVDYFLAHGPVGARDTYTLKVLQDAGIPCYFSGCMTLTLQNPYTKEKRENVIYAVDLDEACLNYVKSHTHCEVRELTHIIPRPLRCEPETRKQMAESLLEKYRKATAVVTTRLHVTLPCLAFETPVLMIGNDPNRFGGLDELFRWCSRDELLMGKVDFNFEHPTPNSTKYLVFRNQLIKTVSAWVKLKKLGE